MGIYSRAAANGKRIQALCEAKNHALIPEDAPIERTAVGIINAAFGCAREPCMALLVPVIPCRFESGHRHQKHIIRTKFSQWETGSDL